MYIFNKNNNPELIIAKSEILFRQDSQDSNLARVLLEDIKEIKLLESSSFEIYMYKDNETINIDFSSFDLANEEVVSILKEELKDKINISEESTVEEETPELKEELPKKKNNILILAILLLLVLAGAFFILTDKKKEPLKKVTVVKKEVLKIIKPKIKKPVIDMNDTKVLTNLGLKYWDEVKYQDALVVFKKAYVIDSNSSSHFLNYFEISLVTDNNVTQEEKEQFETVYKENKDILIRLDMLKILELSIKNEDILPSLKEWDKNYHDLKLNWSFSQIISWLDNSSFSDEEKYRIRKVIGFFIAYQQVYNLKHQQDETVEIK